MMVGPLWYGTAVFENGKKAPDGVPNVLMAAYPPPLSVLGKPITGALGGGFVARVEPLQPAGCCGRVLAEFMSTSPKVQAVGVDVGRPDYTPDQAAYVGSFGPVFANPVVSGKAWETAAAQVERLGPHSVEHRRSLGIDGGAGCDLHPAEHTWKGDELVRPGSGERRQVGRLDG